MRLKTALASTLTCSLILCVLMMGIVLIRVAKLARSFEGTISAATKTLNDADELVRRAGDAVGRADRSQVILAKETSDILTHVRIAADAAAGASRDQRAALDTDQARIQKILSDSDRAINDLSQQTTATLGTIPPLVADLRTATRSAQSVIADPAIHSTIVNLDNTSANVEQASENANRIVAMGEKKVEQMMKPVSLAKRVFWASVKVVAYAFEK